MKKLLLVFLSAIFLSACAQTNLTTSSVNTDVKSNYEDSLQTLAFPVENNFVIWSYSWLNDSNLMIVLKDNQGTGYNRKIYHLDLATNQSDLIFEGELLSSSHDIYIKTGNENFGLQFSMNNLLVFDKNNYKLLNNIKIESYGNYVMVSDDLNKITYSDKNGLWICNLDGSQNKMISKSDSVVYPVWSKDSKSILSFQADENANNLINVYNTEYSASINCNAGKAMSGFWFKDGKHFLSIDSGVTSGQEDIVALLQCFDLSGKIVYSKNEKYIFDVADTSNTEVIVTYSSEDKIGVHNRKMLKSIDILTGQEKELVHTLPFIDIRNVQFSPSLNQLAFIGKQAEGEAKIYLANY